MKHTCELSQHSIYITVKSLPINIVLRSQQVCWRHVRISCKYDMMYMYGYGIFLNYTRSLSKLKQMQLVMQKNKIFNRYRNILSKTIALAKQTYYIHILTNASEI